MGDSSAKSSAGADPRFEQHLVAGGDRLRRNEVEGAIEELEAALAVRADDEKALGLLGLAHFRLSSFAAAREVYERLVDMNPDEPSYRLNLGLVHLKMGRPNAAIEHLTRSRELDPSQARTVSYLGLAYARKGNYSDAYEAFLRAGQSGLAAEMEQYLGEDVRRAIRARVSPTAGGPAPAAAAALREADPDAGRDAEAEWDQAADRDAAEAEASAEAEAEAEAEAAAEPEPELAVEPEPEPAAEPEPEPDPAETAAEPEAAAEPAAEREPEPAAEREPEPEPAGAAEVASNPDDAATADVVSLAAARPPDETAPGASPDQDAVPIAEVSDEGGMITRAVADVVPSSKAAAAARRVSAGHQPPQPVSEFATAALVRPEDGDEPFEIGAGGVLVVRVAGRVLARTEGVVVSSGELGFEPATRRVRGTQTREVFGDGDSRVFVVTGSGYLVAAPGGERFTALRLDEDVLYLREELVFAFEEGLRWESGRVPGSRAELRLVQLRGQGCVALKSERPLLSVKLSGERVMYVDADVLAGWIGRVVPRLVEPAAGGRSSTPFVECSGEGVVLIEDRGSHGR